MTNSSKRIPTFILAAGVLALAATDWMVMNSTANGDNDTVVVEAPTPTKLPDGAFLTGAKVVNTTTINGVTYTVERAGELGYALKLHNPTDAAVTIACDVQSYVTEGSRRGRMMPSAQLKNTEPLTVSLAAGGSHTMALGFADPAPKANAKVRKGWFRTVAFQLREQDVKLTGLISDDVADVVANPNASRRGRRVQPLQGKLLGQIRWTNPAPAKAEVVEAETMQTAVLSK